MKYDLVVVGAGIQGAGVAQAAAAAGYTVLVLEQSSPAAGTSSKSSKLIHGGLRYLESAQFGLVRESLHERALLLKLAPELVKLQPLHIPVYKDAKRSPLTIRAGLSLYSMLSGFNPDATFRSLPQSQWNELDGLKQDNLQAVFRYYEAQTDDAALTRAVLHSAMELGAECEIPGYFVKAHVNSQSCLVEFESEFGFKTASCRVLINCAGPWASDVISRIEPDMYLPKVDLVQGSHLILPPLLKDYFYLEAPQDKRAVFALPWQGKLMLGTTEKTHYGAPEEAQCSEAERDYLLEVLLHYFPHLSIDMNQVDSFAGLRVLPRSDQSAFSRTREVLFEVDNEACPRVLSVMGGKLTTYRSTALMALAKVRRSLPVKEKIADTSRIPLSPVDWH
ncbi:FAD-dependent oxidoreductase [Cellvibrio zantedeschiae]|uniref:FAD-dependent oxidoreductase n=1 Tax=Cellvibrio zantedeschiae TaxID=1237077 RepID=A0ABQ3AY14_9GAMM|nr:FAD-dependent oxidoreductase [Cellvibrio zantedeschiae]GGY68809.1 FAD-dependent oxidoreductase [Cellvibrio zantedeschiae]